MDFDRDDVVADLEIRGGDGVFNVVVFTTDNVAGEVIEGDGTVIDVATEFLVAVEVDDGAVIPDKTDGE